MPTSCAIAQPHLIVTIHFGPQPRIQPICEVIGLEGNIAELRWPVCLAIDELVQLSIIQVLIYANDLAWFAYDFPNPTKMWAVRYRLLLTNARMSFSSSLLMELFSPTKRYCSDLKSRHDPYSSRRRLSSVLLSNYNHATIHLHRLLKRNSFSQVLAASA